MNITPIQNSTAIQVVQTADIKPELSGQKERNSEELSAKSPAAIADTNRKNTQKTDFTKLSDNLQQIFNTPDTALRFSIDKETKKIILKIINSKTNEVVQQIPTEVALKLSQFIASTLEQQGNVTDSII
ncbi:MAG: flagellar protein FlaG [Ignavibacteriae bacterium]|nr:flagellar protein FlaG [Ignavibacteriota bacterium]